MKQETKRTYRVSNPDYNKALEQRGEVDLFLSDDVLEKWNAPHEGREGRPRIYSDAAIQAILALRVMLGLPLRGTRGFIRFIFRVMKLSLRVPSASTLSRRLATLNIELPTLSSPDEPLVIAIDSTGFKIYGAGEWHVRQHGVSKRRTWIKCHLALDVKTLQVVAVVSTPNGVNDCDVFEELLEQIPNPLKAVAADGAYDTFWDHRLLEERECAALIPPCENAVEGKEVVRGTAVPGVAPRNAILKRIAEVGSKIWKEESRYHCRSLAENLMFRLKQLFGERLASRRKDGKTQDNELRLRAFVLNVWTALGMPHSVPVSTAA